MKTIALSGKGGTGKSTVAALIVRWLSENSERSILAVDADSNVNLNDFFGVQLKETVGSIREELKSKTRPLPGGMSKVQFLEYKIQNTLIETPRYDLLTMGRPEGPGCYCYANNLLRDILMTLSSNYGYIIIDNEAGMEHLSRRTAQAIDLLLIVSEPTVRGVRTAARITTLLHELDTRVVRKHLVFNRVRGTIPEAVSRTLREESLDCCLLIPEDPSVYQTGQRGDPIWNLSNESPAYSAISRWLRSTFESEEKGL